MDQANSTSVVHSSDQGKPWLEYELTFVLIFFLGLTLLKLILDFFMRPIKYQAATTNSSLTALEEVIRYVKSAGKVKVEEVVECARQIGDLVDVEGFNELMEACVEANHFHAACRLFKEIKKQFSSVTPNLHTYDIYLKGILESGSVGEGVDGILRDMEEYNLSPNASTFNRILEICVIAGSTSKAWKCFMTMMEYGLKPDCDTYKQIMQSIKMNDKTAKYFEMIFPRFLNFLINEANSIEDPVINTVVDICGRFAHIDKIEQLLAALKKQNRTLNIVTYGKLITIYGNAKQVHKVDSLTAELKQLSLKANEITHGCIMEAYLRCGAYDKVESVYDEINSNKEYATNVIIHTTLIRSLAKQQEFHKVIAHYERLKRTQEFRFNRIIYNALLDCCVRCNQCSKMSEIFEDMLRVATKYKSELSEDGIEPDLITYSTLIKGMCRSGEISKAISLYNEMKRKDLKLDEMLFNSLLDGLAKSNGNLRESERIIGDMTRLRIKFSNYTYSILVKLYTRSRMLHKALKVLDEMKSNKIVPGIVVYTCLIQACIKSKAIDRAIQLFKEMREGKIRPDRIVYNVIINGCIFSGKLLAACTILQQAMEERITLHDDVYNNILRNLLANRKMTAAQKHESATAVCNYVAVHKIPVNEEYFQHVLNELVFTQAVAGYGQYYYHPGSYGYCPSYYQNYVRPYVAKY
eukprot:TRINITY_DN415_c0_g2_i1.p1 TRINITY_DN415_c0_g2~~TRINITY_DN415_c0_g2_i1.p1  ORF type:complete len:694 (+),score=132.19 TRINITY_DN415_c0_g2_i1:89-2170(+)